MSIIKRKFEDFKNKHAHNILLKSSQKPGKLFCSCTNSTGEGEENCPKCFGTGYVYKTSLAKVRRSRRGSGSGNSLNSDALDPNEEFNAHSLSYLYYFDVDIDIKQKDFIIDREKAIKRFHVFMVTNKSQENGDKGIPAFKVALTTKKELPQKVIRESIGIAKKEISLRNKVKKYTDKKTLEIIKKYPDKSKEYKYIEQIIYEILLKEGYENINRKTLEILNVKYNFSTIEEVLDLLTSSLREVIFDIEN